MWQARTDFLNDGRVQRFVILRDGNQLSFADVLSLWGVDAQFRSFFIALLADSPFQAYRWETPCVTSATLTRDFQFVLLRADSLARSVDSTAFAAHFSFDAEIVAFPNIGGDAVLVVPCPIGNPSIYGHLATFVRNSPDSQLHQLWISVAAAMDQRVGDRPVWLSTAGMGVSWLHVRLDDRPKYYGYAPFREVT